MSKSVLVFALFLPLTAALAQETYKCNIGGTMVYQDRPCPGSVRRSDAMPPAKPAAAPAQPAAAGAMAAAESPPIRPAVSDTERQKAFLAKGARDRRISDLQYEIGRTEAAIAQLQSGMHAELAALDRLKAGANNNLAGATYLNSLATEQQAITSRYQVDITTQRERLKYLQEQLAAAKRE